MFSCWWFEEPRLPHSGPLVSRQPSCLSCHSRYLCRSSPPRLPPSPSGDSSHQSAFLLFLPSPGVPGTAVAALRTVPPFWLQPQHVGFETGSRQQDRAEFLEASRPANDSSWFQRQSLGTMHHAESDVRNLLYNQVC